MNRVIVVFLSSKAAGNPFCAAAPEIDASLGAAAISLVTGILMLVSERNRAKRRTSKQADDDKTDQS